MSDVVLPLREIDFHHATSAGGKGTSLARLLQAGFPVPDGFVILPDAFDDQGLQASVWPQVAQQLARLRAGQPECAFAVRSSARAEDSAAASFAGEFETRLNLQSDEAVHAAIEQVYASRHNARVQAYSQAKGLDTEQEIAVIVQVLVPAESAGVLFTAHPVTGQRHQALINAAWGLGEAVVSGQVTPDTLLVDTTRGLLLERQTADKQVMTVLAEDGTREVPVPEEQRRAPVLSDEQALELARLGERIEGLYDLPMDIEWAHSQSGFTILQARPITALPAPEPPAPSEWIVPNPKARYMRNNIVELMAEPLSPLFDSLGRAAVNTSLKGLLDEFLGQPDILRGEMIVSVNHYAYYQADINYRKIGWLLLNSVGIARRMFSGAVERWIEAARPRYQATVNGWRAQAWRGQDGRVLPSTELLVAVRSLAEAAIDAYGALVSGMIPAAWISEAIFTAACKLVSRKGDPAARDYLLGYDSLPIQGEKALYDLANWARERPALASYLGETPAPLLASQLEAKQPPAGIDDDLWEAWRDRFQAHLQAYGHMIYNLDFANPVPADQPAPLLETLKLFLRGEGRDPHTRQQAAAERRDRITQAMLARRKGPGGWLFRKTLAPAQKYAPLREDALAEVGLAYPLLRAMLHEIGERLVASGALESPEQVFWLRESELENAAHHLDLGEATGDLSATIPERQASLRSASRVSPPLSLPQMRFLGRDLEDWLPGRRRKVEAGQLRGVAASPGKVTATARVLHGPEDFHLMQTGDVLVAAITTPAWTPLFARAAAVVTDVGGPLSHGSIVAREYGIPAVLGTVDATRVLHSGELVTVDGSAGTVTVGTNGRP